MQWLKLVFSDPNGVPDDGRITAVLAILTGLALAVYAVVKMHQPFDLQQYGVGMAALMAGAGGMLRLRGNN